MRRNLCAASCPARLRSWESQLRVLAPWLARTLLLPRLRVLQVVDVLCLRMQRRVPLLVALVPRLRVLAPWLARTLLLPRLRVLQVVDVLVVDMVAVRLLWVVVLVRSLVAVQGLALDALPTDLLYRGPPTDETQQDSLDSV